MSQLFRRNRDSLANPVMQKGTSPAQFIDFFPRDTELLGCLGNAHGTVSGVVVDGAQHFRKQLPSKGKTNWSTPQLCDDLVGVWEVVAQGEFCSLVDDVTGCLAVGKVRVLPFGNVPGLLVEPFSELVGSHTQG